MDEIIIFILLVVLMYDAWLIMTGKPTISQVYQRLFATWIDMVFLVGVIGIIIVLPTMAINKLLLGVVAGHLFWPNKERHI